MTDEDAIERFHRIRHVRRGQGPPPGSIGEALLRSAGMEPNATTLPIGDQPSAGPPGAYTALIMGCRCSPLLNAWGAGVRERVGDVPVSVTWLVDPLCGVHERVQASDGPAEGEG